MGLLNNSRISLVKAPIGVLPRCPSCREALKELWVLQEGVFAGVERVVMCPHCHVLLGYAFD